MWGFVMGFGSGKSKFGLLWLVSGQKSLNLEHFVIDLGVRKVQIWVFGMGFGAGKFEFGSLWWDLGQESPSFGFL